MADWHCSGCGNLNWCAATQASRPALNALNADGVPFLACLPPRWWCRARRSECNRCHQRKPFDERHDDRGGSNERARQPPPPLPPPPHQHQQRPPPPHHHHHHHHREDAGLPRGFGEEAASRGGGQGGLPPRPPPPNIDPGAGDWCCPKCSNWNFARRNDVLLRYARRSLTFAHGAPPWSPPMEPPHARRSLTFAISISISPHSLAA